MLKDEFLNLDIYVAIILREDGSIESIMGAHGETLGVIYEEYRSRFWRH